MLYKPLLTLLFVCISALCINAYTATFAVEDARYCNKCKAALDKGYKEFYKSYYGDAFNRGHHPGDHAKGLGDILGGWVLTSVQGALDRIHGYALDDCPVRMYLSWGGKHSKQSNEHITKNWCGYFDF